MSEIRIDMFEVQLGAAILLQFAEEGGSVSVLADAGVKASGYPPEHVRDKVLPILDTVGDRRIDLMIGTHYDEDHLNGLVPIIADTSVAIGEAWMPPVVNDTQQFPLDGMVQRGDLLPQQLYGAGGTGTLARYLLAKRHDCELLRTLEGLEGAQDIAAFGEGAEPSFFDGDPLDIAFFRAQLEDRDGPDDIRTHLTDALGDLAGPDDHDPKARENQADHAPALDIDAGEVLEQGIRDMRLDHFPYWFEYQKPSSLMKRLDEVRQHRPTIGAAQARSLANLRKGAAKDAINCKALHAVMQALAARGIPIRTEIIDDGEPRRFRWDAANRRFQLARPDATGLSFTLLGPSKSLVKKHRDRLPVVEAARVALQFRGELLSITPSNQLSYIGRFAHAGQGILVAGDAGCVDFSNGRNRYYPKLLAALEALHVIQVAHHGGNNGHFYRVLKAAGFPTTGAPSLLLLSHAYHDRTRPSPAFEDFLLSTRGDDDVKLLFTSEPNRDKVATYLSAIHPRVGAKADVGDVSLAFEAGAWSVKAHAIAP